MSNISKQLSKLDLSKVKMKNGKTVVDELKRHAVILVTCITECLSDVYDDYSPKVWNRDYSLYNSVCIDEWVEVRTSAKGVELSIGLYFDEGAWHKSFDGRDVNAAYLINYGYETNGSFKDVPYLGFRKPTYFIEEGIEEYKRRVDKPFGIRLVKEY